MSWLKETTDFPIYPVKATSAKGLRIEALEPLFRNLRMYLPGGYMEEELGRGYCERDRRVHT